MENPKRPREQQPADKHHKRQLPESHTVNRPARTDSHAIGNIEIIYKKTYASEKNHKDALSPEKIHSLMEKEVTDLAITEALLESEIKRSEEAVDGIIDTELRDFFKD